MGLIDRLIDRIFNSAKSAKKDAIVNNLRQKNPKLGKLIDQHKSTTHDIRKELLRLAKERGVDITK